jgi:hypothetical protein
MRVRLVGDDHGDFAEDGLYGGLQASSFAGRGAPEPSIPVFEASSQLLVGQRVRQERCLPDEVVSGRVLTATSWSF